MLVAACAIFSALARAYILRATAMRIIASYGAITYSFVEVDDKGRFVDREAFSNTIRGAFCEHMPWIRGLDASGLQTVDGRFMEAVATFVELEYIDLSYSNMDEASLSVIESHKLRMLDVSGTIISKAGIRAIGDFSHLERVGLSDTKVCDADILLLVRTCPKLREIALANTSVTKEAMAALTSAGVSVEVAYR